MFQALDFVMLGGCVAGAVPLPCDGLVERLHHQRGFAAAADASDAGERAERNIGVDVLQIVAACAAHADGALLVEPAAFVGDGDLAAAGQIVAGDGVLVLLDVSGRSLRNDLAAMDAGGGAHVDDVIGGEDRLFVMFDDEHRIAEIA